MTDAPNTDETLRGALRDEADALADAEAEARTGLGAPDLNGRPLPAGPADRTATPEPKIQIEDVRFFYGEKEVLKGITMDVAPHRVTAFIGPSGCGKSTLLRCINRMNELIPGSRLEIFGECGHWPQHEHAAKFDALNLAFLREGQ